MTKKPIVDDIVEISAGLTQWFVSQEVPPGRAVSVMCYLISAMCLASDNAAAGLTGDPMTMAEAAADTICGLTMLGLQNKQRGEVGT